MHIAILTFEGFNELEPVGEKDDCVERAMRNLRPCLGTAVASA